VRHHTTYHVSNLEEHILLILLNNIRSAREITKVFEELSGGLTIPEGSVYMKLNKLEDNKFIKRVKKPNTANNGRRGLIYYKNTIKGVFSIYISKQLREKLIQS